MDLSGPELPNLTLHLLSVHQPLVYRTRAVLVYQTRAVLVTQTRVVLVTQIRAVLVNQARAVLVNQECCFSYVLRMSRYVPLGQLLRPKGFWV